MATAIASPGPTPEAPAEGRALAAFGLIGWRWISRNPASAIAPILQPFIFLYFLSLISPAGSSPSRSSARCCSRRRTSAAG